MWIETLYFIAKICQVVFQGINLILTPILWLLWYLFTFLYELPGMIRNSKLVASLTGESSQQQDDDKIFLFSQKTQEDFSPEFKDLVFAMLSYNMLDRPSLAQIKNHPWLKGPVPSH